MNERKPNEKQPDDATLDEPVMDGAHDTINGSIDPRKGQDDPALIRHPAEGDKTVAPYNLD